MRIQTLRYSSEDEAGLDNHDPQQDLKSSANLLVECAKALQSDEGSSRFVALLARAKAVLSSLHLAQVPSRTPLMHVLVLKTESGFRDERSRQLKRQSKQLACLEMP